MRHLKSALLASCLGLTLAAPVAAEGDPKPGILDVITPDRVAESVASLSISALRTVMEVEYEHLSTDIMRGTVSLSGVTLRPQLPYDRARQCEITIQRAGFDLGKFRPDLSASNASVTMIGAKANIACVPRELGLAMRAAGYNEVELDRLAMEVDYVHGTGEIRTNGSAAINNMLTIDLATAGAILPRLNEYGTPGDPAIRVRKAVLGIQDTGGWERLSSQIPENLRQPEVIQGLGTEELTNMLSNNGTRALTATERNFIDDLMEHVAEFIRDPGEITIEAQLPASGIVLEPDVYETPEELLQALAPDARTAPRAQSDLLDPALLARINGDLSGPERLELAQALLAGAGVPKAEGLVPDLLAPLLGDGTDEAARAALLTARAQLTIDPASAYRNSLAASSARLPGAVPLLDALEAKLTTGEVIAAQDAHSPGYAALPDGADIRAVRELALAHFTGLGAPRNYRQAYYFALIAEAAGDIGAQPLREDIEARFANRGEAVDALWSDLRIATQQQALGDWIAEDLATRFLRSE
ncbi:hypothetical protein EI983_10845 [Roseovarius faecimaris]|uniref:Sel1 repeat family protein n=1 Tax=Roseovarius faecimaris TaxID=2494550 RepID=A0A6I6INP7_9RHOB|nr:hypothetical protein [Roseovarius faecimaris]QGX98740.1 hypothetical protein EI983_10845 [Roseovarius faecimaris]